ncbi:MAG: ATP-binding cassette domain-containing protein [Lachnospiraceae bacterium]|nr:ATP-binding cassette domain-containing protein [Lachnospiraceae bacterium]
MASTKKNSKAVWMIMEELLEVDNIDEALDGFISTLVKTLKSEAGAIWILNKKTDLLHCMFNVGPLDLTDMIIENGRGLEGRVTQSASKVFAPHVEGDSDYELSCFDERGFTVTSAICVPLTTPNDVFGCIMVANRQDGDLYSREDVTLCNQMASLVAATIEEKGLVPEDTGDKEVIVSVNNLTKEYAGGSNIKGALRGINLDIYKNELLVILGESGCGKGTLFNLIGGLDEPSKGSVMVEGRELSALSDHELSKYRRKYLGFVFSEHNLMPNLTALENIRFAAELVDYPLMPEEALSMVKLSELADNYPEQMTIEEGQRVSIARAIVKKPRLILADEPTAGLDCKSGTELLEIIEKVVRSQGATVMMITHNSEIAKMADRVVKLRSGRIKSIRRNIHPIAAKELEW